METQILLDKLTQQSRYIFDNNLVGVYLHGSMALGCFNPKKSDLDLLIVVENEITDNQKKQFMDAVVALNEAAPANGIELSVVRKKHCKNLVYPTPFDLHFSNTHLNWYKNDPYDYIEKMKGIDYDLAAHFVITKGRGIVLYGEEINNVFGEIPTEAYLDSITRDISDVESDMIEDPMYMILTLCRVLAFIQDNLILSKTEGGEWGLRNVDSKYHVLIEEALGCYTSDRRLQPDMPLTMEYCEYMKNRIGI